MRPITTENTKRPDVVDPGAAPILQWLKIDQLVVDERYQRELKPGNWKAIRRIAAHFKWSRFSPVFVAPVEGGSFAIIDGQHRVHAASICGFAEVPCQIVQMTLEEQAAAFAAVNGMVTKVTVWHIYKAALAAGENWAITCARIATDAGCTLMTGNKSHWLKKPKEIYGVSTFRKLVDAYQPDHITAALRAIVDAEGYGDAPEIWDMSILRPLIASLCQREHVLQNDELPRMLENFDIWALNDRIVAENRERIRKGLPYATKADSMEAAILDRLDRRFPQRVALPEPA